MARPRLTLIGTRDCHLCHVMRAVVERVAPAFEVRVEERELASDPAFAVYRFEIPVLLLDEREVARHRISEAELRERLIGLGLAPVRR